MQIFELLAGIASIASLVISIITLQKVIHISNVVIDKRTHMGVQSVTAMDLSQSHVAQVGGDSNANTDNQR